MALSTQPLSTGTYGGAGTSGAAAPPVTVDASLTTARTRSFTATATANPARSVAAQLTANRSARSFTATGSVSFTAPARLTANRSARSFAGSATTGTGVNANLTANRSARSFTGTATATGGQASLSANRATRTFTAAPAVGVSTTIWAQAGGGSWNRTARRFDTLAAPDIPFTPVPATWRNLWRVSPVMPAPTLDNRGLPVNWVPTSVTVEQWGRFAVVADGVDVTNFRNVPTVIEQYESTQPFGDSSAVIRWPQITPFDDLASTSGPTPWMDRGVDVEVFKVAPNGVRAARWCGFVLSLEHEVDDTSFGFAPHLMGALYQADLQAHQPPLSYREKDIGYVVYDELNTVVSKRYAIIGKPATGILTRMRGDRTQTRLTGYVQDLLGQAQDINGTQWTVNQGQDNGRVYYINERDTTTVHATVTAGTPGVTLALSSDLSSGPTAVYGKYVRPDGGVGQNTKYPDPYNLDSAFYFPLALNWNTEPNTYDDETGGNTYKVTGFNPSYDPDQIRVDRYEDFGEGITKADAQRSAREEIDRSVNVGWMGSITLHIDPEEISRFDLRAGMNIKLKHFTNRDFVFHIARCLARPNDGTVELTVDTKARDLMTLNSVIQRNKAAATDPIRRNLPTKKRSRLIPDVLAQWDADAKSGFVPNTSLVAGWNVLQVQAGQFINAIRTGAAAGTGLRSDEIVEGTQNPFGHTDPVPGAVEYAWGVFGKPITVADVARMVGNPLDTNNKRPWNTQADALIDAGIQAAWGGTDGQGSVTAAGYWPGTGASGDPVTGKMLDDGSWWFESLSPPWMWVAVYLKTAASFAARLVAGVTD